MHRNVWIRRLISAPGIVFMLIALTGALTAG